MIYLAQTDTTAGFLSKSQKEINLAKKRNLNQTCIKTSYYFYELKNTARTPNNRKNLLRRARKTTFVFKNNSSFRVIKNCKHSLFLKDFRYLYSSSANMHGKDFCLDYASKVANVIVDTEFFSNSSSKMLKINAKKIKKLR